MASLEARYERLACATGVAVAPAEVAADCGLVRELRAYASAAVAAQREVIDANLAALPKDASVDLAFPGAAYFSVACGGLAEVQPKDTI